MRRPSITDCPDSSRVPSAALSNSQVAHKITDTSRPGAKSLRRVFLPTIQRDRPARHVLFAFTCSGVTGRDIAESGKISGKLRQENQEMKKRTHLSRLSPLTRCGRSCSLQASVTCRTVMFPSSDHTCLRRPRPDATNMATTFDQTVGQDACHPDIFRSTVNSIRQDRRGPDLQLSHVIPRLPPSC